MSPEHDDYLDDNPEPSGRKRGGVLAAGWLRALLVLATLAVLLIVSVPYILEWVAPSQPLPRPMARTASEPARSETSSAPPVAAQAPAPAPATAPAPAVPDPKADPVTKSEPVPASEPAAKSEPPKSEPPKSEPAKTEPAKTPMTARASEPAAPKAAAPKATAAATKSSMTPTAAGGEYWVQVGLFANNDNAERLAKELREERFAVEIAQTSRGGVSEPVNQHEVIVIGSTVETVTAALKGTGTAEAGAGGVVVRPAMDLKDAVTLSRRLAGEGLQVRIRRVTASATGGTLYLVRVGGYPTRDAAAAGKRELAAKGVGGFVTQGPVK